jgi:hypothetical protein
MSNRSTVIARVLEQHSSVIHFAHAAARRERRSFLLRVLGDRRLGGDDLTRDGCGVLEGRAHDLRRIDDAERNEIAIFAGLRRPRAPDSVRRACKLKQSRLSCRVGLSL